jgi:hypothetical protein
LVLPEGGKEIVRNLHRSQRRERLAAAQPFLARALPRLLGNFASGDEIDPKKIQLSLIPVKSGTAEADLFRIATLTWSVPVSPGFGRRMRYLVWDEGHDRFAGVIALGDPVYNLSVRDKKIEWIVHDRAKRLVGILDAYVLGAVPPYSMLLVGKAIASLIRSKDVYDDFTRQYGSSVGVISKVEKKARLLAVTTTSSMGRSAVYNRLKLGGEEYFQRLGFTEGWGHFHITNASALGGCRVRFVGPDERYVPASNLLSLSKKERRLNAFPTSCSPIFTFENGATGLTQILEPLSKLVERPCWVLRRESNGLYKEVLGSHVRTAQKYLILTRGQIPQEVAERAGITHVPISAAEVKAYQLSTPTPLDNAQKSALEALGIGTVTSVRIDAVGLNPRPSLADEPPTWLSTESVTLRLKADFEAEAFHVGLDGQSHQKCPCAGGELLISIRSSGAWSP